MSVEVLFYMKKILIISELIAPFQGIASIRWTKIAKYLKKNHDVHISVVTIDKRYKGISLHLTQTRIDKLLKKDLVYFDNYWLVPGGKILSARFKIKNFFHVEKKLVSQTDQKSGEDLALPSKSSYSLYKEKIRGKLREIDKDLYEGIQLIIAENVFKLLEKGNIGEYDVVISTYDPMWCHFVAKKLKKRYPHLCWLADFRDPCAVDFDTKRSFKRHKEFVRKHCSNANYLLRVNENISLYQASDQKLVEVSNGFDPEEALEALPPSKFYVVYTGSIYSLDDLGELFHAFRELIDSELMDDKDVVFQYAGHYGDLFYKYACKWEMDYLVEDLGVVSRERSLSLQQKAAILLIAGWNTKISHCEWIGKAFEYMMAQKPIIYMMAGEVPHSLPSREMEKLGGVCYEQCRHEETYSFLKQYILEKYQEWKETGNVTIRCDENYKNQYAYPKIAEQVWSLIQ